MLKRFLILFGVIGSLVFIGIPLLIARTSYRWQWNWVHVVPGVRLEPAWPVLKESRKRLPAGLEELTPEILPRVPSDPFDGKALRYVAKASGAWIVYSVGPNQIDEGGMAPERIPNSYDKPGDVVFSSTEPDDERRKLK